jgi:LacI family transcriptional regulator
MVNIFDIAKLAGVSKTTVSKALNNQYGVNADTRERVLEAVKKLNYTPNHAARSLVTSKTGVIGIIYDAFNIPIYQELANCLERSVAKYGYNLVFCNCNDDHLIKEKYIHYFTGGASDGIILFGSDLRDKEFIIRLKELDYPFVVIENHFDDLNVNDVMIDSYEGARMSANYLIGLGHTRIAHITGDVTHRVALERLNGYISALRDHHLPYNPQYVVYTNGKPGNGEDAVKKILKLDDKPTAVFAFNDILAYETISNFIRLGYKIPDDFSVVGFDNISSMISFIPSFIALTSVGQPMEEVAEASIKILLENIKDRSLPPQEMVFNTYLVEGKSCKRV